MQLNKIVIIVGAGPAGLMAAEVIAAAGHQVHVYDAKPSACRKFLLAGVGGMNITHSEAYPDFISRYYEKAQWLDTAISQFNNNAVRQWIHDLGIGTFVGSSGRVFPADMKAAPLLRLWLKRLRESGVVFHMRHKLIDLTEENLTFEHNGELINTSADAVVLAMGGASWPKLGSDGKWQSFLAAAKVNIRPLQSANCGFYCQWSEHIRTKYSGAPLKNIAVEFTTIDNQLIKRKGECIVSSDGMEGSLIYALSKHLRDAINFAGQAVCYVDLLPELSIEQIGKKLNNKRPKESFSKYLKRTLGLGNIKSALLYEDCSKSQLDDAEKLARCIKSIPITFTKAKPIEQAISSAGGVCQTSVNDQLMLQTLPSIFCAGEMLDWEAPTGGYLLTACFATGRLAGKGVCDYLSD